MLVRENNNGCGRAGVVMEGRKDARCGWITIVIWKKEK